MNNVAHILSTPDNIIAFPTTKPKRNTILGANGTVEPIRSKEDIQAIKQYFLSRNQPRNYLMWVLGINVGLRASDLLKLTIGDVALSDGTPRDILMVKEKKTAKRREVVLNRSAKEAVSYYLRELKWYSMEEYLFSSREGGYIEVRTAAGILRGVAKELGLQVNIGTHTMRKTFGYHQFMAHKQDNEVLCYLQKLFNHDSPKTTLAYIGMEQEKKRQMYLEVEL